MRQLTVQGDKLSVRFDGVGFDECLTAVRAITGRRFYKRPEPQWLIPLTPWHAREAIRLLQPLGFPIPKDVEKQAAKADVAMKASRRVRARTADPRLYPFQNAALEFLDMVGGRAIIADDMGLGKTVEALVWAASKPYIHRVLVVCPANVLWKWKAECEKWLPKLPPRVVETTSELVDWSKPAVYLMTYTIMTRRERELREVVFDLVVLDEFHYIKTYRPTKAGGKGSQRGMAAQMVCGPAKHLLLLSGTPFLNRPIELYPGLLLLDPKAWGDHKAFVFHYAGGMEGWSDEGPRGFGRGATHKVELASRLRTVMIRRTKAEVLPQLPPLSRVLLPVQVDLKEYKKVAHEVVAALRRLNPRHKGYFVNALDQLSALRMAVGKAKIEAAVSWATDFLQQTDPATKLVIYCHHKEVVDGIAKGVARFGVQTITEDVSPKKRADIIEEHQSGRPRVLIITTAGSEGINLFGLGDVDSSRLLVVEREWTPALEEQVEARLHRVGQASAVTAYYLVAKGTVDEQMAAMIDEKRADFSDILHAEKVKTTVAKALFDYLTGDGE